MFWQWNLHHSIAANAELAKLFTSEKSKHVVVLTTEPYLGRNKQAVNPHHDLKIFSAGLAPRAAIISKNIDLWLCPSFSGRDVTTCLMRTSSNKEILLSSAYLDITANELPGELTRLLDARGDKPLLLGMDTNAHSPLWGSKSENARGDWLESILMHHNLCVLNTGSVPTFVAQIGSSVIDVTACSPDLFCLVNEWHVVNKHEMSDHRRLRFVLMEQPPVRPKVWDVRNANWPTFVQEMESRSSNWNPRSSIDKEAILFKHDLNCSLLKATKWIQPGTKKVKIKWWNDELSDLRVKVRRLERTPFLSEEDHQQLKATRRLYKRAIRRAKATAWQEYTSSAMNHEDMARLAKSVFRSKHSLGMLQHDDGSHTSSIEDLSNMLFDKFFPGSTAVNNIRSTAGTAAEWLEVPADTVTVRKVKLAFASFGKFKAEGPDGFRPVVLQNLGETSLSRICWLYQQCLKSGYTPLDWRKTKVIFIPKPGKEDYSKVKAFRPISLSSFILKGLERIVLWYLEENNPNLFHVEQHAFRKGHSTETALQNFVDSVESAILRKQSALAVMLDISGAFDSVLPSRIIEAMEKRGINRFVTRWYSHYLHNRFAQTELSGKISSRKLMRGTPQGGVLSPFAWNIIFDSLLESLNVGPVKAVGYADDCALVVRGFDPCTMVDVMQQSISKALKWGERSGLEFSVEKTEAIFFTRKNTVDVKNLKMRNRTINYSKSVKYLGVTLDRKLLMTEHIDKKIKQCKSKLARFRSAIGVKWGPEPRLMLWMHKAFILPALSYGALVWGHRLGDRFNLKLLKLNRLALAGLGPMRRGTPTAGLEVILGIPPLQLHILGQGLCAFQRWRPSLRNTWDHISSIDSNSMVQFWERKADELCLPIKAEDKAFCYNWRPEHDLSRGRFEENFFDKAVVSLDEKTSVGSVEFFTASSNTRKNYRFDSINTKVQILCSLITLACNTLLSDLSSTVPILISTPSFPSFLGRPWLVRKTEMDCLMAFRKANKARRRVTLIKSSGKTSRLPLDLPTSSMINLPAPVGTFSSKVDTWIKDTWRKKWNKTETCGQTRFWFPDIKPELSKSISELGRIRLGQVIQFLTGHCWLKRHVAIVEKTNDTSCRLCGANGSTYSTMETPIHLVTSCPSMVSAINEINTRVLLVDLQDEDQIRNHWSLSWLDLVLQDTTMSSLDGLRGRTTISSTLSGTPVDGGT